MTREPILVSAEQAQHWRFREDPKGGGYWFIGYWLANKPGIFYEQGRVFGRKLAADVCDFKNANQAEAQR